MVANTLDRRRMIRRKELVFTIFRTAVITKESGKTTKWKEEGACITIEIELLIREISKMTNSMDSEYCTIGVKGKNRKWITIT